MASFTLAPGVFPAGTTVEARKRSAWLAADQNNPVGTPGSADASATTAADSTTTFSGLADDTRYIASGTVSGTTRYVQFRTAKPGDGSDGSPESATASHNTVSIGTSAALIVGASDARQSLLVENIHASNVLYVGSSASVTTGNGIRLSPGESIEFTDYTGAVYGIASAASTDVRYLSVGA